MLETAYVYSAFVQLRDCMQPWFLIRINLSLLSFNWITRSGPTSLTQRNQGDFLLQAWSQRKQRQNEISRNTTAVSQQRHQIFFPASRQTSEHFLKVTNPNMLSPTNLTTTLTESSLSAADSGGYLGPLLKQGRIKVMFLHSELFRSKRRQKSRWNQLIHRFFQHHGSYNVLSEITRRVYSLLVFGKVAFVVMHTKHFSQTIDHKQWTTRPVLTV